MTYKIDNLSVLIFTDLDSSFLNKNDFSFGNNLNTTKQLINDGHSVIFNTSKTFIELKNFFQKESFNIPFICENGGGIYAPKKHFNNFNQTKNEYNIIFESKRIVRKISSIKNEIKKIYGKYLTFFNDLDDAEKEKLSGLSRNEIKLASEREFTELIIWQSNSENLQKLKEYLESHNLTIIKGGRFHHISNNINKGEAMLRLVNEYKKHYSSTNFITIAVGDSDNKEMQINATDHEHYLLTYLIAGEDKSDFTKKVLNNKELKDFVTRNFQDDVTKLDEWVSKNSEVKRYVTNSGQMTIELYDMEYELGENESVEDIDWESEARMELTAGMSGEFYGEEQYGTLNEYKTVKLDTSKINVIREVA